MNCPACKTPQLAMTERSGIEIDYCPDCRGVWLDRGELDKLIQAGKTQQPEPRDSRESHHDMNRYSGKYPKRRKSFLEELFD